MEQINFSATDGVMLNGFLHKSNLKTQNIILSVHGMSSNCFKDREVIISQIANGENIDYFCFNNRGSELVKYIKKNIDGKKVKLLAGSTFEDVLDGYYDIVGAIIKLKELGYPNIYLLGHSLGCTKIVYTYNKLKSINSNLIENIKGIMLLSLVDIPNVLKFYLKDNYTKYLELAINKENEGKLYDIMPNDASIHPISVKTFLRYIRDNKEIEIDNYKKVNNIKVPIFMRWGTENEMILQKPQELVDIVNKLLDNPKKDIGYIAKANHSYNGKEEIVAKQIIKFIKQDIK